jgi:DNA (cytosine-5)-methyltransferase 1
MKTEKIKVLDLFSGIGGLSYGFANDSAFEIIAANEIYKPAAIAYTLNHPKIKMYNTDIKTLGLEILKKDINIKDGEVDVIIGGPPCQSYSTAGKRLLDDPRGKLFLEYYRVLKEIKPKIFIFENVVGLISMQKGELFKNIINLFEQLNYKVSFKVLNAVNYGVPQNRERVFIVGSLLNKFFNFPAISHGNIDNISLFNNNLKSVITLKDAISDLPFIKSAEESFEYEKEPQNDFQKLMRLNQFNILTEHSTPNNNPNLIKLMNALPDGGTPLDLPEQLRPKSGFANTYSKLWWNRPSPTLTRNFSTPSSARCIHPIASRPLTTREGARIQSFPDNYLFYGSKADKNLQIGNAVPPLLSIEIKNMVLSYLTNNQYKIFINTKHTHLIS